VEGVTYRVQVVVPSDKVVYQTFPGRQEGVLGPTETISLSHLYPGPVEASCYERPRLLARDSITGPAIIREENSTTFVPIGRCATVGAFGELVVV
jgi:N-methylhydantoinase A